MINNHKKFVEYYLINNNAALAYSLSYPNCKRSSCASGAERLMRKPLIKELIVEGQLRLSTVTTITKEKILTKLEKIMEDTTSINPSAALKAADLIIKMLGYNAPIETKTDLTLKGEQPLFMELPLLDQPLLNED